MNSKKVFLAPDSLIAFIDRGNGKHVHAAAFFRYFAQQQYQLYVNIVGINEAYTTIYQTISPSLARDFLKALSLSTINLLYPEESDIKAAYKTLLTYPSTELTFSEALMAVLANRKNIPQICTFSYLHALFGLQLFYLPL